MSAARPFFSVVRWPAMVACWAAWGFVIGMVLAVTAPLAFGLRPLTVLTGSMRPAIEPGDMVVDEPIPAGQLKVGDIVTFQEPRGERTVTHRVRKVTVSGGQTQVTTKGDANDKPERWQVPSTGEVGRVDYVVPKIGYPVTWSHTKNARLALVSVPALILTLWALLWIWRRDAASDPEGREVAHGTES